MINPKCLLSENIDDHNWSQNQRPDAEIFKKPHVVTGCYCIDCFAIYHVVWGEPNRSPWTPWRHGDWIFKISPGEDLSDVIRSILHMKSISEKIGVVWPEDHMFNKLKDRE